MFYGAQRVLQPSAFVVGDDDIVDIAVINDGIVWPPTHSLLSLKRINPESSTQLFKGDSHVAIRNLHRVIEFIAGPSGSHKARGLHGTAPQQSQWSIPIGTTGSAVVQSASIGTALPLRNSISL
jgi:hypothetical protein